MKNIVIVYKSRYGTTKRYAEWIAEALDAPVFEASEIKPAQLMSYDLVIYGGGLYVGGIDGVKLVAKNPCKALAIFTVGLADPRVTNYSEFFSKHFTENQLSQIKVFHLRGSIDYKRLGLIHKGLMAMLKQQTAKKNKSELTNDDKMLLETYGKSTDFVDKASIAPIVTFAKEKLSISTI